MYKVGNVSVTLQGNTFLSFVQYLLKYDNMTILTFVHHLIYQLLPNLNLLT